MVIEAVLQLAQSLEGWPYLLSIVACCGECGVPLNYRVLRKNLPARMDGFAVVIISLSGFSSGPRELTLRQKQCEIAGSQASAEISLSACLRCRDAQCSTSPARGGGIDPSAGPRNMQEHVSQIFFSPGMAASQDLDAVLIWQRTLMPRCSSFQESCLTSAAAK